VAPSTIDYAWRGTVTSEELNALHAEAFETRVFTVAEWDWARQLEQHSHGWVTARRDGELVGFVNVISDGSVHGWLQDVMVARSAGRQGIGTQVVALARDQARVAGMEWLHVDFDDELRDFYYRSCGFRPTNAGLIELSSEEA
jgi:GNAT superfamily N-acetyltransferase